MKRALMYASVASMIQQFNMHNIALLQSLGYEVDVACNLEQGSTITPEKIAVMRKNLEEMGVKVFHIPVPRKVTAVSGILDAFRGSLQLMNERRYDLIHCHSPIGGMICRLANRRSAGYGNTKLIYTAHGFHFYKGAPKKNWLLYYPVEKICSCFTDVLITINKEDYALAVQKMYAKQTIYVPGIGVDTQKFSSFGCGADKRRELGLADTDKVIISVGELSARKNHEVIIRALAKLDDLDAKYVIVGLGSGKEYLLELADQLGVRERVMLLGYRSDIAELLNACDIYAFPSLQEGLPVALMEAMSVGKAVVCSEIRGNTDLIQNGVGGFLVPANDVDRYAEAIKELLDSKALRAAMGRVNQENIKKFDTRTVNADMCRIYSEAVLSVCKEDKDRCER